ncbi:unnamed protein product (macronuclear) [Paramecium tetraurelia]|uniref:PX domain-containing protein n=1 Tax=Paramecium tetraurelia TaxID=5888 RepID=A0DGR1_PARTE|nr:uncharacterized protein GSPATT00002357001 [Paramecium tetraurelia]CAK82228.1 unnamed protein product [Paramecium tetraurelia]|eukprot:XP_001449625.1 hypothetical protein (macronuclear) [Paramecium tetraurelia strain d4-2]
MFELNPNELKSYQEKYDKLMKAKVTLHFKQTKKILIGQFSVTDAQADSILKKVFSSQSSDELNKEGFFMALRYVQCLQNKVDIETCNINTIKLQFPLRVNCKSSLKKSFQTPSHEDILEKSMIALQNLQNLVKVPSTQERQKSQIHTQTRDNQNQQIQKELENIDLEKNMINLGGIHSFQQQINQPKAENSIIQPFFGYEQQIIKTNLESQAQMMKSEQHLITEFGVIDVGQNKNKSQQQQSLEDPFKTNGMPYDNDQTQMQVANAVPKEIKENIPDVIEIDEDEEEVILKHEDSKDIYVWISGYQQFKDAPFTQTYYSYKVCSEILTDPLNGSYTKFQVWRRYTDFKMLQQYFTQTKLGDIIPSLPEKEGVLASLMNMVVENPEFISQRQEQLQLFLQYSTRYKDDQILLQFLSNEKKFDLILKELRVMKGDNYDEDTFLPDPDEFTRKQKWKELIAGKQIIELFDYFKGKKEIEAKFQEEYRQVQQQFKILENKKLELSKFKQCLNQFYDPIDKFSSSSQLQQTQIISEDNIRQVLETQKLFQANYSKHQNLIMNQVTQIEFQLNSLTYSYEQIQKQIYKWFDEKKRLREEKKSSKLEIQKNELEEQRLQFVISKTNETLIKLVKQITEDLKGLLKDFVEELTQI